MNVLIIGGGITGLTLALALHRAGISCRVFEAAPEIRSLGVGINLQPHGVRTLSDLGLEDALAKVAVATSEMGFYNRFGQLIHAEPRGRAAGYDWPQFSVHRGALHRVQIEAVRARLGDDSIVLDHRCVAIDQSGDGVTVHFADRPSVRGTVAIACDGIHSAVRRQFYPNEGGLVYQGINMWRGTTRWRPFLSGSSMVQVGWLDVGKLVIYPIEAKPDDHGKQRINWVAEFRSPRQAMADWNGGGRLDDFFPHFADWAFEWLDVPGMLRHAEEVLEYPMVDRDPLPAWSHDRVTLAGDAAHPMYSRGGNGAGQGILDASALADCLMRHQDPIAALAAYDEKRRVHANNVVIANRNEPPDTILRLVHERTGDRPFTRVGDVISADELREISDRYKKIAGFDRATLQRPRKADS